MKKNVLYIAASGEIIGGGQISLLTLLEGLDQSKFNSIIFCPSEGNFVDRLREKNFETYVFQPTPRAIVRFCKFIKERQINLIHCNAGASKPTFYGAITARLTSIPFIWHVRVLDSGWRDRILANLSTKIIAISRAVAKKFSCLNSDKIVIIWNGVDLKQYDANISGDKIRQEFNISSDCHVIGIVGRLVSWKGHKYFIKAARKIVDRFPNSIFLIVGDEARDSEYKIELESLVTELNLGENIIFTGFRRDVPQIMKALDVFVLSSIDEPFGRVVIEAMAMAKPVVATNAGGVLDIVVDGETGILVPVKDPDAIAQAVVKLLSDSKKAELMGKRGRKRVERCFSVKTHVEKVERLYNSVIER